MIELPAAYDIVWVAAHLILPFIVFVIWMFYRLSESRKTP
jgi:flagellar biogenesis protein FliO